METIHAKMDGFSTAMKNQLSPVLEMVSLLFLELYQLLQYSYDCSSVMSVYPEGGGSARDTRVSLTSVDMVSRLAKSCWMSTIPTVCRGSRQV